MYGGELQNERDLMKSAANTLLENLFRKNMRTYCYTPKDMLDNVQIFLKSELIKLLFPVYS